MPPRVGLRRSALTEALAPERERRLVAERERRELAECERREADAAASALLLTAERKDLPRIRTTNESQGGSMFARDVVVTVGCDTPEHDAICARVLERLHRPLAAPRRRRHDQRTAAAPTAFDRLGHAMRGSASA